MKDSFTPLLIVSFLLFSLATISAWNFPSDSTTLTTYDANITNFTELLDTPSSYSGQGDLCVVVNSAGTGLAFGNCSSSAGDITAVNAGTGLTGGGTIGSVTLNVNGTYVTETVNSTGLVINWSDYIGSISDTTILTTDAYNTSQFTEDDSQLNVNQTWLTGFINSVGNFFSGDWTDLTNVPTGFADGIDNDTSAALTHVSNFTNDFGYYNSTDFNINDYYLNSNPYGYYNSTVFSIADYYTITQIEGFNYYNLTAFDIDDYRTESNLTFNGNGTFSVDVCVGGNCLSNVSTSGGDTINNIENITQYVLPNGTQVFPHETGWADYVDTQYNTSVRFTASDGVLADFPNNAGTIRDAYIPDYIANSGGFYNGTHIIGREGDAYGVGVRFSSEPQSNDIECEFYYDIEGGVGQLKARTITFPKGLGVQQDIKFYGGEYTLDTWEDNGGRLELECNGGDVEFWDISYVIFLLHRANSSILFDAKWNVDSSEGLLYNDTDTFYINNTKLNETISDLAVLGASGGNTSEEMQDAVASAFNISLIYDDAGNEIGVNTTYLQVLFDTIYHPLWDYDYADLINVPTLLSDFTDDLGNRGYTHLSNFTNDLSFVNNNSGGLHLNFSKIQSEDWSNVSITESQISDLDHYTDADIDGTETAFNGWDKDASDDITQTYGNATYILQDNEANLNVNSSDYWDNFDSVNTTQFENEGGLLHLAESWFSSLFDQLFAAKDTDDLSQGSINLYDNRSWNETWADTQYAPFGSGNSSWNESHADTLYIELTDTFGGEVSGTYDNLVLNNDALDDQYYDSEGDLTALLDDNYVNVAGDTMTGDLNISDTNITTDGVGRIYSNSTCIKIRGATSIFEIC